MGKFTKIEVHFTTKNGDRTAVVVSDEHVEAIFLGGSESKFLPPPQGKRPPPKRDVKVIPNDDVALVDGPQVCYLVDGVLHCW